MPTYVQNRLNHTIPLQLFTLMDESNPLSALSALNELVQVSNYEDATIALEIAKDVSDLRANIHFLWGINPLHRSILSL